MSEFNPQKLHVHFDDRVNNQKVIFPRRYTLTHSDMTGDLFLSIGNDYDYKKLSNLYTRIMRDEVLGELQNLEQIRLYCHCSGGIALGPAKWRDLTFRHHMPMVLEAICYGDRVFLTKNKIFLKAPIYIHFHAKQKTLDRIEKWGTIYDFMPENQPDSE